MIETLKNIASKDEKIAFLKANKDAILLQKAEGIKFSDGISYGGLFSQKEAIKDENEEIGVITVKIVANSTNILDSHMDVHVKGNYDDAVLNKEGYLHLKDHKRESDSTVGVVKSVATEELSYRDIGIDKDGTTECLVYESKVMKLLNEGIYNRYKAGLINQHSVGMRYKELDLAMNDDDSPKEKAIWDKYYSMIANPQKADENGFFWVVKNIELVECSAVLVGSNQFTPTISAKTAKHDNSACKTGYLLALAKRNIRKRKFLN